MRRMRSLRLLHKTPKCVAQLSGIIFVVPKAVREWCLGSQDSIVWTAASNPCLCSYVKFSRGARDAPPERW